MPIKAVKNINPSRNWLNFNSEIKVMSPVLTEDNKKQLSNHEKMSKTQYNACRNIQNALALV